MSDPMTDVQATLDDILANGIPRTAATLGRIQAKVKLLVEQRGELEAIVRDLAAVLNPPRDSEGNCWACGRTVMGQNLLVHADNCGWRRLREWVSARPVSGTETTDGE